MARKVIVECDQCGQAGEPYVLESGEERFSVDLCPTHATPILTTFQQYGRSVVIEPERPRESRSAKLLETYVRGLPRL